VWDGSLSISARIEFRNASFEHGGLPFFVPKISSTLSPAQIFTTRFLTQLHDISTSSAIYLMFNSFCIAFLTPFIVSLVMVDCGFLVIIVDME
jgi:hypothetical protein